MGTTTKIKNINGTSEANCSCGSWIKHWETFSGSKANYCAEETCTGQDVVGAHVQKAEGYDDKWYIIPLCNKHNKSTGTLNVLDAYKLIPANKRETCEKPRY